MRSVSVRALHSYAPVATSKSLRHCHNSLNNLISYLYVGNGRIGQGKAHRLGINSNSGARKLANWLLRIWIAHSELGEVQSKFGYWRTSNEASTAEVWECRTAQP